ncbi:hypothetical protein ABK040_010957 [Willaertia magna]
MDEIQALSFHELYYLKTLFKSKEIGNSFGIITGSTQTQMLKQLRSVPINGFGYNDLELTLKIPGHSSTTEQVAHTMVFCEQFHKIKVTSEDVDIIKSQFGISHYSIILNTMIWRTIGTIPTTTEEAVEQEISQYFGIYTRDLELTDRSKLFQLTTISLNCESVEENLDNNLISTYLIKVNGRYEFRDIILRKYIALHLVSPNDNDSHSYRFDYLVMMPFIRLGERLKSHRLDGFLSTLLENFDLSTKTSLMSKLNHYAQKYNLRVLSGTKQLVVHLEELFILIRNLFSHQHRLVTNIKEIVLSTYFKQNAKLLISLGNEVDDHLDFCR